MYAGPRKLDDASDEERMNVQQQPRGRWRRVALESDMAIIEFEGAVPVRIAVQDARAEPLTAVFPGVVVDTLRLPPSRQSATCRSEP